MQVAPKGGEEVSGRVGAMQPDHSAATAAHSPSNRAARYQPIGAAPGVSPLPYSAPKPACNAPCAGSISAVEKLAYASVSTLPLAFSTSKRQGVPRTPGHGHGEVQR